MNYAITGSNGLLGSALCKFLDSRGDKVYKLCRNPQKNSDSRHFVMGEKYDETLLDDVDVLIGTQVQTSFVDGMF